MLAVVGCTDLLPTIVFSGYFEIAYTPIAIFNVLYVQYKLDKASYKRFEEFLDLTELFSLEKERSWDKGLLKNYCVQILILWICIMRVCNDCIFTQK